MHICISKIQKEYKLLQLKKNLNLYKISLLILYLKNNLLEKCNLDFRINLQIIKQIILFMKLKDLEKLLRFNNH